MWIAGIGLAKTTDVIYRAFGLGEALGGLILLAVAGSLPELAITVSAAAKGNLGLAAGFSFGSTRCFAGGKDDATLGAAVCDPDCRR